MIQLHPISTAPRNGQTIVVGHHDVGEFEMHWNPAGANPLAQSGRGIWETADHAITWSARDGQGPEYWHPVGGRQ